VVKGVCSLGSPENSEIAVGPLAVSSGAVGLSESAARQEYLARRSIVRMA
jgi:hypothetical protein